MQIKESKKQRIQGLPEMVNALKNIENIKLSQNVQSKIGMGNIKEDDIISNIKNPQRLKYFKEGKQKFEGDSYALYFEVSGRRTLFIGIRFLNNEHKNIKVTTAYYIYKELKRMVKKYGKRIF